MTGVRYTVGEIISGLLTISADDICAVLTVILIINNIHFRRVRLPHTQKVEATAKANKNWIEKRTLKWYTIYAVADYGFLFRPIV
jgi:hypothetical protein